MIPGKLCYVTVAPYTNEILKDKNEYKYVLIHSILNKNMQYNIKNMYDVKVKNHINALIQRESCDTILHSA